MGFETLLYEVAEGVATISFNRPKVFNAYSVQMSAELKQAVKRVADDSAVRVLILRGSGENYMAGADISMLNEWTAMAEKEGVSAVRAHLGEHFAPTLLEELPVPVISAIDGYCFGMGMEIAAACDFRIATERAVFCQPEINVGIITGGGASQRLPRIIGRAMASQLILTGDNFTAAQMNDWGWLNAMTPPEGLFEAVGKLVKRLKSKSPLMIKLAKECILKTLTQPLYDGISFELDTFCTVFATEDAKEGTAAFLERRKPNFTGK